MAKKPVVKKPARETETTLLDELCDAVNTTVNEGEPFQEFAVRLGIALSDLDDEAYGKLSPAAVKWFTAATDAINADKEAPILVGFPETDGDEAEEEEPEPEVEASESEVKKKGSKPAVKKDEPKPETKLKGKEMVKKVAKKGNGTRPAVKKPKAEKKERAQRTDSVAYKLRVAGVKQPEISFEDACKKAGIKAVEGGHAWNVWYLTKLTMQVVKEING